MKEKGYIKKPSEVKEPVWLASFCWEKEVIL